MAKVFTYSFTVGGNTGTISITTGDTTQSITTRSGTSYDGWAITGISGNFNGQAITGLFGASGQYELHAANNNSYANNAIFSSATQGDNRPATTGGSFNGIDTNGIAFTLANGHVAYVYKDRNQSFRYSEYNSATSNQGTTGGTPTFVSSNYDTVACFLAGTLIRTTRGDVPVEDLAAGNLLVTADGETRPVKWIGRQVMLAGLFGQDRSQPVRVVAGALDEGLPVRDLYLSPDHALLIDGVLAQAGALVNGTTVTRVSMPGPAFTYYHVETEDHAVILAEGTPAETFVSNVTRRAFDNYAEYEALFGARADFEAMAERDEPRAMSARQVPAAIKARLSARAAILMPLDAVAA